MRELSAWVARDDWEGLLDGFARCVRITRSESERHPLNAAALVEPQEKTLYNAYQQAAAALNADANVGAFLSAFAPLLPAITDFFNHVMVNAPEPELRRARLGLLQAISAMQQGRADLSHLTGF